MALIVSTHYAVTGVHNDGDVRKALQALYDIFTAQGMGQATFELTGEDTANLVVKHKDTATPDVAEMNRVLALAGAYKIVAIK